MNGKIRNGQGMPLRDTYGRSINYLRLSVIDQCNLRCLYCIPERRQQEAESRELLSFGELLRIARAAVAIGVEKIRVTGGEPLCRDGILGFLSDLKRIPGLRKLVLTTNGILLDTMADGLMTAGVDSLNISLDSLDAGRYREITRCGSLDRVMRGIEAAERAGYRHLKFNVVVMRGVNDDELSDFASLTLAKPYKVRFIEYMPTAAGGDSAKYTIPGEELLERLGRVFSLQPVNRSSMDGPAVYHRIAGAAGEIGFITPISCHFCHDCNRIRVTSTGVLKGCLFDNGVMSLRQILSDKDDGALQAALRRVVRVKPQKHHLGDDGDDSAPISMSGIGG